MIIVMPTHESRCSADTPVDLRWYGWPHVAYGQKLDVPTAVDKLFAAVSGDGRVWNPFARTITRREFSDRIEQAMAGKLVPVDEVKPVDEGSTPPMFEIRWQDIPVTNRTEGGGLSHAEVVVRMYHSEPESTPGHFIAHHAHEKVFGDGIDDWAEQNREIAVAVKFCKYGEQDRWDIPEVAA